MPAGRTCESQVARGIVLLMIRQAIQQEILDPNLFLDPFSLWKLYDLSHGAQYLRNDAPGIAHHGSKSIPVAVKEQLPS